MERAAPLLICYDGSHSARAAVDRVARLFAGREAVVACYWQPFAQSSGRFATQILELVQDPNTINEREERFAKEIAAEGAALVRAGGMAAHEVASKVDGPIEEAILAHAEAIDAAAIV